ncbi:MAG: hypothetical protein AAF208_04575 [Cyanobacteria bacterium P01_A01_bin.45]
MKPFPTVFLKTLSINTLIKTLPVIFAATSTLFYIPDIAQGEPVRTKRNSITRKTLRKNIRVSIFDNGTQIQIQDGRTTQIIKVNSLTLNAINSVNCQTGQIVPTQKLSAQRVYPQAVNIDPKTGNLAVGAVMQNCFDSQMSAIFILQPQNSWKSYAIYRMQVPGKTALPDEFSTHLLRSITKIGYFDNDILIKHSDASGSGATLIFTPSRTPAGKYAGCVITNPGESRNICPQSI